MDQKTEKVIMEAKLSGGEKRRSLNLGVTEATAADSITKSLIADFMLLLNVAGLRAIFAKFPNRKELIADIRDAWTKRVTIQLEEETKKFQTAIFDALNSQEKIDNDTSKKMEESLNSFCRSRDKAVELANKSIDSIVETIVGEDEKKEDAKTDAAENRPQEEAKNETDAK